MEPIFEHALTLTEMYVDRFGRCRPAALLYMIQEAAGHHCALLAVDHDTLSREHLFWAVSRSRVQVSRLPRLGETVTLKTWPMPTTRVAYPRAVAAYDAAGRELFRSISLWILMDERTRAMVLPGKSGIAVEGMVTGTELAVPHAVAVKPMENIRHQTVGYSLLDRNGHMNNTKYLDWVDDLLPAALHKEKTAREFVICYLAEALEQQQIQLDWNLSETGCLQVDAHREKTGVSQGKERIFTVQVLYE